MSAGLRLSMHARCSGLVAFVGVLSTVALVSQTAPDLFVSGVSLNATLRSPGTSMDVTDTVRNLGSSNTGPSVTYFYLSLDAVQSASDIKLTGTRPLQGLAAGAESGGTTTLVVPSTTAPAAYHVLACADGSRVVVETIEANNCAASSTVVTIALGDLTLTSIGAVPTAIRPGASFTVTDTLRNASNVGVGPSTTRYYLSTDAIRNAGDRLLGGNRSIVALESDAISTSSVNLTVPLNAPPAPYFLVACADDTSKIPETIETNNCRPSEASFVVTWPDLVPTALGSPPALLAPGMAFLAADTVRNSGPVEVATSTTRYYLSLDGIKDPSDVLLGSRSVPLLAAGATSTGSRTVTVPATVPLGSYFLLSCADDALKRTESDEANNCRASASALALAYPDLVMLGVSDAPATAVPGTVITVADTVQNAGPVTASASFVRYYLSLDGPTGRQVQLAGARSLPSLQPGAVSSGSRSVTIPTDAPHATYVLVACADDTGVVAETDGDNNCRDSSSQVIIRAPNLRPDADAGFDRDVSVGENIHLDGLASSDGDGDPLTYAWTMRSRPNGSSAALVDPTSPVPQFTVDAAGQFILELVVSDGKDLSAPDVVIVAVGATRFAALGDTGFGDAGQYAGAAALAAKCLRSGCGFVLLLGDNIYESGVSSANDPQFSSKFEAPYAGVDVPFHAVLGNHDYGGDGLGNEFHKGQFQVDYSGLSPKWRMPAAYYRWSTGPIEFFGLDTTMQMYGQDQTQRIDVAAWLGESTAPWKIALGHHPYRSNGQHGNAGTYNGTSGVPVMSGDGVKSFMDDIVCGRVDLLLSGHDHNLQWLRPNASCSGTELVVSGAGAKPKSLRPAGSPYYNESYFQAAQRGFAYVVVTLHQLTIEFVGEDGAVLFTKTLTK